MYEKVKLLHGLGCLSRDTLTITVKWISREVCFNSKKQLFRGCFKTGKIGQLDLASKQ